VGKSNREYFFQWKKQPWIRWFQCKKATVNMFFSVQNSKASIEIIVKGPETYKSTNDVWSSTNPGETPRGPFLTSPLGANFDPQGQSCPSGMSLSPRGEVIPWGWNSLFDPSILLNSREWTAPLGDKFHPWGPGVKLRMALWGQFYILPQGVNCESQGLSWSHGVNVVPYRGEVVPDGEDSLFAPPFFQKKSVCSPQGVIWHLGDHNSLYATYFVKPFSRDGLWENRSQQKTFCAQRYISTKWTS
jgi:hypothetical protein